MGARDMVNQMCLLGSSTCHISCANKNPPPYNDCYTQSISGFHGNVEGISPQLDYARESCEAEEDSTGMNQSHNEQYGIESPEPQGDDECQSLFSTTSGDGASKKKMKRFRLSRNQTRYLMSEFTRQAHPDAAQRERLSREIPGLSPRQVQVWFQNRRAKLKRMSIDDRERVLKSRAIPDSFDMAKALNWPYATYSGASSKPAASINLKDLIKKDSSTLTEPSTFLGGEYANVTTSDISSSAYYTPISQPASNSDTNLENASSTVGYREAPFTQWAYSQIPSPPLDSAVASEPESFGESESPPNSHWVGIPPGNSISPISPSTFSLPTPRCSVSSQISSGILHNDRPLTTRLPSRNFINTYNTQPERQSLGLHPLATTPHSSANLAAHSNPTFNLSSFGVSFSPEGPPALGFPQPGFSFDPHSRYAGLAYSSDSTRNLWDTGS